MIKNKKIKFMLGCLLFVCSCGLCTAALTLPLGAESVRAVTFEEDVALKDSYAVGEILAVPKGILSVGEQTYEATSHVLYYPSSKTTVADTAVLTEAGIYTLEYRATVNGKTVKDNVKFTASEKLFTVSGNGASARLGYYGDEDLDYIDSDRANALKYPYAADMSGIRLTLTENSVFTYNKLIDISNMSADDVLLDYMMLPNEQGIADLYEIQVTFTDALNPENQMIVKYQEVTPSNESWSWTLTFVQGKATGQQFTGIENEKIQVGGSYGSSGYFAFNGNGRQPVGKEFMRLHYDSEALRLYHTSSRGKVLICDFDDPKFFGMNTWNGFESGKVFLSLTGRRFTGDSANILVKEIYGQDLSADAPEYVSVEDAPVITVDTKGYAQLPVAVVGKEYPIFSYSARDEYGSRVQSSVKVYYGYGSTTQVELDGYNSSFVPDREGLYTLKYTATNAFGKTAEKIFNVNCLKNAPIEIVLPDNPVTEGVAGTTMTIATPVIRGGSGQIECEVEIEHNGERLSVTDGTFIPEDSGEYRVVYKATDFIGQVCEKSYTVSVIAKDEPILKNVNLPEYFLVGYDYRLPVVQAYNYARKQNVDTVMSATGGSISGNIFRADTAGVAKITYTANGVCVFEKEVKIIDGTKKYTDEYDGQEYTGIDSAQYFDLYNMSVTQTEKQTRFSAQAKGEAGFTFVNALYADGFSVVFAIPGGADDFDALNILLTDSEDSSVQLKIGLRPSQGGITLVELNGVSTGNSLTYALTSGREIRLTYSQTNHSVTDSFDLKQKTTGFDGFPSGKVYFSVDFEENKGNSGIVIYEINSQGINSLPYDSVLPVTKIIDPMPILVEKGQIVDIARAIGADVFNPQLTGYVTVQKIGGAYLTSSDGVVLSPQTKATYSCNYQVEFGEYGTYIVSYVTIDSNGNKAIALNYSLRVIDKDAPVINVQGNVKTSASVGETIQLPQATATDNNGNVTVAILIVEPSGRMVNLKGATKYTFNAAGRYIVRYLAADAEGNVTTIDYAVEVK